MSEREDGNILARRQSDGAEENLQSGRAAAAACVCTLKTRGRQKGRASRETRICIKGERTGDWRGGG